VGNRVKRGPWPLVASLGWAKTTLRGKRRIDASFTPALAADNLARLLKPLAETPP